MSDLTQEKCAACRVDVPRLSDQEIEELALSAPAWAIERRDAILQLERIYKFTNFVDAIAFTNSVAELAELEGHHPALLTEWGRVTVTWWSHKIGGLHRNDFIMAAKTEQIFTDRTP